LNDLSKSETASIDLLEILVREKLISPAQAQLVKADHEVTGMTIEEILLARHWVNKEKLAALLPSSQKPAVDGDDTSKSEYEKNLSEYRRLMSEILGEPSD
jgi:hypothetical protein